MDLTPVQCSDVPKHPAFSWYDDTPEPVLPVIVPQESAQQACSNFAESESATAAVQRPVLREPFVESDEDVDEQPCCNPAEADEYMWVRSPAGICHVIVKQTDSALRAACGSMFSSSMLIDQPLPGDIVCMRGGCVRMRSLCL